MLRSTQLSKVFVTALLSGAFVLGLLFSVQPTQRTQAAPQATTPTTITVDGNLSDWDSDEDVAGTSGATWYFTWDANNFYFAINAPDVNSGSSTKWVELYLDTDPQTNPLSGNGSSTGVHYNTQQPGLPFRADYHFRWKANNTYTNMLDWNNGTSSWTDDNTGSGNFGITVARSGSVLEVRIPRASLGNPAALYFVGAMLNEQAFNESTFFMTPNLNTEGYDPDFGYYYGVVLENNAALGGTCAARVGNGLFGDVQHAVDFAPADSTVKIAGTCAGVKTRNTTLQTAFINKALTVVGGYTTTNWTTAYPVTQVTTLDAQGGGRGLYLTAAATVQDLTVKNGKLTGGGESGGGIYASQPITLSGVTVYSNSVNNTGGGLLANAGAALINSVIQNNQSGSYGGGFVVWNGTLTLSGTQVLTNTANSVAAGGGAAMSGATVTNGLFQGNISNGGTGGLYAGAGANITATRFINNSAFAGGAGALYLPGGNSRIVNSLFAGNYASQPGSALQIPTGGLVEIIHSTIVTATSTDTSAIQVTNGTVNITSTILSGYPLGLWQAGGVVNENYNLFDNVATPYSGTVTSGGNSITDTAAFFDTTNYTLTASSAAIDRGINAGVTTDYFGNPRPQGNGYDIGYYESPFGRFSVFLPLIVR